MKVDVLDADSGKVLGTVEDTPGCSRHRHRFPGAAPGVHTNGGNATVSVFDTNTFKTIKTITVGKDPDFVSTIRKQNAVLVCHGDAAGDHSDRSKKQEVTGKIDLGGGAEAAVVDGKGTGVRQSGNRRRGQL